MTPNDEQAVAIAAMLDHLKTTGDDPYFVLRGPAGTGKTFTSTNSLLQFKRRVIVTAPTNKAVRVLREALKQWDLRLECRTIYSLLGLKLAPNGEIKELTKPEDPVDLEDVAAVFVDEWSMVNQALWGHIQDAQQRHKRLRWVFMGDQYQLPPVGEMSSPIAGLTKGSELTRIMRQDNQILKLAAHLRDMVAKPFAQLRLIEDNNGEEGIWKPVSLDQAILNQAQGFAKGENKAIAWRNATVDRLNRLIRQELFADGDKYPWQEGDRITLLEPAMNFDNEIIGTTDEEGAVEDSQIANHPEHEEFKCWRILMRSDMNTAMTLWVLHDDPKNKFLFEQRKARLATVARANPKAWGEYWSFMESFHKVRHAYAITAHRAQGSTYQRAFVNWKDILANQNRGEAMRCLYVAATRPKKELYLG
jgi:exodeoxyribonuclease-5